MADNSIYNPSIISYNESGAVIGITIIRHFSATVAGGGGQTSIFLTSDGLTKGAGNAFLFTNVRNVWGTTNTIQAVTEAPVFSGYSYNAATGQLICLFLESNTTAVLIGGTIEGLEVEENGTAIKITVIGD